MNTERLIEKINLLMKSYDENNSIEDMGNEYHISCFGEIFKHEKNEFIELVARYNELDTEGETTIYDDNYYETLIDKNFSVGIFGGSTGYAHKDSQKEIDYHIGNISKLYIIFILDKYISNDNVKLLVRTSYVDSQLLDFKYSVFDAMNLIFKKFKTVKIDSANKLGVNRLKELVDGLFFNIGFQAGKAIIPVKYFDDILVSESINYEFNTVQNVDTPQRKYIRDLVYYYQMGVGTNDTSSKFISFFHVIEYFLNEIYNEYLVELVRNKITSPKFSVNNNNNIMGLINLIKKNVQISEDRNEVRNQKEAIKLVLKKYVKIEDLKENISNRKSIGLDYYINNNVDFAQAKKINFNNKDEENVYSDIANRINSIRNAVVHSKVDEKARYVPFEHDLELLKEISLIQAISEEIIISTSEVLS